MHQQFKEIINYFNQLLLNKLPAETWIAGGAPRNYFMSKNLDMSNDIDLYFPDENSYNQVCLYCIDNGQLVYENENTRRYELNDIPLEVDCIKNFYKTSQDVIKDIDFTINSVVITKDQVYHHDTFFIDLSSRSLKLNRKNGHLNNIFARIYKLLEIGFDIQNDELKNIIDKQRDVYNKDIKKFQFKIAKISDSIDKNDFEAIKLETNDDVHNWLNMAYSQVCLDIYRHIESNEIKDPKIKAEIIAHRGVTFENDRSHFLEKRYPHGPDENPVTLYINDQQEIIEFDETRHTQISIRNEDAIYEP